MMEKKTPIIPTWTINCQFPAYQCTETEYLMDAHTEGLTVQGHPELAIVVSIPVETAGEILNTLGTRITNGESFTIPGIYENILQEEYPVRVIRTEYGLGKEVMVLFLLDENRHLPEDQGCEEPYSLQPEYLRRIENDYIYDGPLFKGN